MRIFKSVGRILSTLLTVLLAAVLICNIYIIAVRAITGNALPKIFGYSSAVVLSGSMSGTIEVNDMIVLHQEDGYETGDVIAYSIGGNYVTHRIIAQTEEGFITRGDANNTEDLEPVQLSQIAGKVVFVIPKAGMVSEYARTPLGLMCLVLSAFLLIAVPALLGRED